MGKMKGLWTSMTPEQQKAALEYNGPINHGPDEFLMTPERREQILSELTQEAQERGEYDWPHVVNRKKERHPRAVYVGRPTKWGNPFQIGKHGSREEVIEKYKTYLLNSPHLMNSLHELKGKVLECWCAPEACHADILLELANVE